MLFLFKSEEIAIFKYLESTYLTFAENLEESETWLNNLEIIENMEVLNRVVTQLKIYINLLHKNQTSINENLSFNFCFLNEMIEQNRQNIMMNIGVHESLILFLKENNLNRENLMELYDLIYKFFVCFAFNNPANQRIVSEYNFIWFKDINLELG